MNIDCLANHHSLAHSCCANLKDAQAESERLRAQLAEARGLIQMALDELGVPQPGYPAPVANAVEFLKAALEVKP